VRSLDGRRFVLKMVPVDDLTQARAVSAQQMAQYDRVENQHLVRRHGTIAVAGSVLALVLDEVTGGSLAQLLGARGQLTAGETVTTVAPLFRALADLHAAGIVHGDLAPGNIRFSADGRPLIGNLGVARLLGRPAGLLDGSGSGSGGFAAPELAGGAMPSPASDVYAMAALGWFCLTGSPPGPATTRLSLATSRPDAPAGLAEVLTACLAIDPDARPSADEAAVEVFDAAPAESVALASVSDPAAEITRRIRAAAVAAPTPAGRWERYRTPLVVGMVALLLAGVVGAGATWFLRRPPAVVQPAAMQSATRSSTPSTRASARESTTVQRVIPTPTSTPTRSPVRVAPMRASRSSNEVVMAPGSPRAAAAGLLQALVDARALAYVARNSALLDLVYAPGATRADVDRGNIATALKNGGTYLGLSYIIKDAVFLDGSLGTARIEATILTPAYATGQPDGRKIPHAQEVLGPCTFSLSLTPDGWRILGLTVPGSP
jgi:hypothetical protein